MREGEEDCHGIAQHLISRITKECLLHSKRPPLWCSVQVDLMSLDRGSGVIAHFFAYQRQDHRLAALSFDPRYSTTPTPTVLLYCM